MKKYCQTESESSTLDDQAIYYNREPYECKESSSIDCQYNCQPIYYNREKECDPICRPKNFNNPDVCTFRSLITPLSSLTPINSKTPGPIEFRMRRKNKVVTLQWEPFSGIITTTGINYLMLAQTICNLPPYSVYGVYNIIYNGVGRICPIEVHPATVKSNLLFYLNTNSTSEGVNANDSITVQGGCLTWIVE